MNTYLASVLEPYSVSPPEWTLLGCLYEKRKMLPSELAQYLQVKPPVVTISLRRLEKNKIILKNRHTSDARFATVTLTGRGKEIVEEAEQKMKDDLKEFTKDFKQSDLKVYFKVLGKISDKLNEAAAGQAERRQYASFTQ